MNCHCRLVTESPLPHCSNELGTSECVTWVLQKIDQQVVLAGCQHHVLAADRDLVGDEVHADLAVADDDMGIAGFRRGLARRDYTQGLGARL